jgi:sulfotransferase
MTTFHFIAGLPRSGSDLLRDILAQRPDTWATSTSTVSEEYGVLRLLWSKSVEVRGELHFDQEGTERRLKTVLRRLLEAHYEEHQSAFVFDKGREWINHVDSLFQTHPTSKIVVTVRNPLDCFASAHKRHMEFPILSDAVPGEMHIEKIGRYFDAQKGVIGSNLVRIENVLACGRERFPSVVFVQFEELVKEPKKTMQKLYAELGIESFNHNFDQVEPRARDLDVLQLNKFPHRREAGPVVPPATTWKGVIPDSAAMSIAKSYPHTFKRWEYR